MPAKNYGTIHSCGQNLGLQSVCGPESTFRNQGHFVFLPLQGDQAQSSSHTPHQGAGEPPNRADTPISEKRIPSFLSSPPLACNTPASSHFDLISFQNGLEASTKKSGSLTANGTC